MLNQTGTRREDGTHCGEERPFLLRSWLGQVEVVVVVVASVAASVVASVASVASAVWHDFEVE